MPLPLPSPASRRPTLPSSLTVISGEEVPALAFAHPTRFNARRIRPVQNQVSVNAKPLGGVWLGPVWHDEDGEVVTDWSRRSDDRLMITRVDLVPTARVLRIDSAADLDTLHEALPPPIDLAEYFGIPADEIPPMFGMIAGLCDWERLATVVDAVWATATACRETRHRHEGPSLNTWDDPSVLVLNRHVVTAAK